ncbi:MAG TPA: hypothetical protein VGC64_06930 [Pyrinomonadaceae bacterium]
MRRFIFALLPALLIAALCFIPSGSRASSVPTLLRVAQRTVYKTYTNARYAYSISYPANLLVPQGEADNGDGQAFRSRDGAAEMRVYGSQDLGGGLAEAYREAQSGKNVTYKTLKRNWFVVSGTEGGKIFYQKTMFRNDVFKTFTIEYDESRKGTYDAVTARIAQSFTG